MAACGRAQSPMLQTSRASHEGLGSVAGDLEAQLSNNVLCSIRASISRSWPRSWKAFCLNRCGGFWEETDQIRLLTLGMKQPVTEWRSLSSQAYIRPGSLAVRTLPEPLPTIRPQGVAERLSRILSLWKSNSLSSGQYRIQEMGK